MVTSERAALLARAIPMSFRQHILCVIIIGLVTGCAQNKTVYHLDASTFDEASLDMIQEVTGIAFPDGTRGIRLAYFGDGLDPLLYAKVEIPAAENKSFHERLVELPTRRGGIHIPETHKVDWWDSISEDSVLLARLFNHDGNGVSLKYCFEGERWCLYILWVKL